MAHAWKACWVQALGGSNPPSSATGPRNRPGSGVLLLVPRLISGRRESCPPASRPRREPSARRVASKPGQAPPPPTGTAAWPSDTLHTCGASCTCGSVRRLVVHPSPAGPATASNRALLSAVNGPTRPRHHPRAPHTGPTRPVVTSKRAPARQDAPSLPQRGQHRDKTLPAQLARSQNGTKLSLHTQNGPKCAFFGEQGEFCHASTANRPRRANFVTRAPPNRPHRANFVTENAPQRQCRTTSVSPSAARQHVTPCVRTSMTRTNQTVRRTAAR